MIYTMAASRVANLPPEDFERFKPHIVTSRNLLGDFFTFSTYKMDDSTFDLFGKAVLGRLVRR